MKIIRSYVHVHKLLFSKTTDLYTLQIKIISPKGMHWNNIYSSREMMEVTRIRSYVHVH